MFKRVVFFHDAFLFERNNMKNISVLGSTGSIGTQTLDVVRHYPKDFCVKALACGSNIDLLEKQIREFHPLYANVEKEEDAKALKVRVSDLDVSIGYGMEGLIEAAVYDEVDVVVTAFVGMMGIRPTIEAIKAGKDIALANKETLVTAGHIVMPLAKKMGVKILPVDSEHSAIFQSLDDDCDSRIRRILLTCSGGPFRGMSASELVNKKKEDALKHPNWSMGSKITIDSATYVNKGLEVIEAKWLFGVDVDDIQVVVHPQSIIHSMVEYVDGAVIAQLGSPDMRLPIQYALFYPKRYPMDTDKLNFYDIAKLTFEEPDMKTFRGLALAYKVAREGGNRAVVFNAANEVCVAKFLRDEIGFLDIYDGIEKALEKIRFIENPTLEEIIATKDEVEEALS